MVNHAVLRVAQMAQADELTIAAGQTGFSLMDHAGVAVAREIARRYTPRPIAVLCGPGNNGGDGFVVARELLQAGWPVTLALLGSRSQLRNEAAAHAELWRAPIEPLSLSVLDRAELIVDALFGAGLNRPLGADLVAMLSRAGERDIPLIAVDVPSGVMGDSGEVHGAAHATLTVTFAAKKPAHLLLPGRDVCGEVVVCDIGIPESVLSTVHVNTWENHPSLWRKSFPLRDAEANKYSRGHVLISGGYPMTGAARLSALAAARIGAGLTSVAVDPAAFAIYASALTSVMVRPMSRPEDFNQLLADKRYNGFLIGPGAGVNATTRQRALDMLATARPVVLDADALTVFADTPTALFEAIRGACVLTPHEGEFRRLFSVSGHKLERARSAAAASGCIIILKGSDTVIAAPDGRAVINSNAPATLATGGAGDVLSGLILGLLGQGMPAFDAACAAVWVHGAAASAFGPGLIADDVPGLIPGVLRGINAA